MWSGKTVVVTGSTRGIGLAVARAFAGAGAAVLVHGRDQVAGERIVADLAAAGGRATFAAIDLTDPLAPQALVDAALAWSGRLDVLVNNAGANTFTGVLSTSLDEWDQALNLDLRAAWLATVAAAAVMAPGSAIVNVSSNHAFATIPGAFPYNVAKAGMIALTQSSALELSDRGIRVNALCPGYIDTPINEAFFGTFPDPAAERRRVEQIHPVRRMGTVDEVAEAVLFLASDTCGFMTGSTLTLDGGRSALLQDPVLTEERGQ
ncbi:MAG: SDR family oxidoreductase [Actinobacteria bacterium]|nr:SDR family oxidoreductase [Actinomycetota bacterium]